MHFSRKHFILSFIKMPTSAPYNDYGGKEKERKRPTIQTAVYA